MHCATCENATVPKCGRKLVASGVCHLRPKNCNSTVTLQKVTSNILRFSNQVLFMYIFWKKNVSGLEFRWKKGPEMSKCAIYCISGPQVTPQCIDNCIKTRQLNARPCSCPIVKLSPDTLHGNDQGRRYSNEVFRVVSSRMMPIRNARTPFR
jgi:hypothetical protein